MSILLILGVFAVIMIILQIIMIRVMEAEQQKMAEAILRSIKKCPPHKWILGLDECLFCSNCKKKVSEINNA